jgi:hypothetical protein
MYWKTSISELLSEVSKSGSPLPLPATWVTTFVLLPHQYRLTHCHFIRRFQHTLEVASVFKSD